MSRRLWLAIVAAVVLVGLAVYSLGRERVARRRGDPVAEEHGGGAVLGHGGGGIVGAGADRDGSARVRGEVVDEDGLPLTEGAVTLRCLRGGQITALGSVALNEEGTFEAAGCRGQVCASLQHPSQRPRDAWVLRAGVDEHLETQSLPRLWGVVRDESGHAIEAARVIFGPGGAKDERDPLALIPLATRSTTTDADGRFVVAWIERPPCGPCEEARGGCQALPPFVDVLRATATAQGSASARVEWAIDESVGEDPDEPLVIVMPSAGDLLTGRLLDGDGRAYPRAYVLASPIDRPAELRRADVDRDGNFELDGLGEGIQQLRALQDGVELATARGEAGQDVTLRGELAATGVELEVRVVDGEGAPLVKARVDGGPFRQARTDVKGRVRASRVLPGSLRLLVRAGPDAVRETVTVPEADPEDPAHPHRVQVRFDPESGDAAQ